MQLGVPTVRPDSTSRSSEQLLQTASLKDFAGRMPLVLVERLERSLLDVLAGEDDMPAVTPQRIAELPVLVVVERFDKQNHLRRSQLHLHPCALGHHPRLSMTEVHVNDHADGRSTDPILGPPWNPEDAWWISGLGSMTN
jgi:hypothetical protein